MTTRRWQSLAPYLGFVLASIAVHGTFVWQVSPEILSGGLIDTDSHMRILRVQELRDTWRWYDDVFERSNAPWGETSHWTRPLDMVLFAGALLLAPVTGFARGLYWSAVAVGPLLQILTGILLAWAAAPLVRWHRLLMFVLLVQPAAMVYALAGRADHHGVILLAFTVTFGYAVRMLLDPDHRPAAVLAGVWTGVGMWISTEFLLPMAALLGASALLWVLRSGAYGAANLRLATGLVAATAASLVLERPPSGLASVEYDKLSVVHLATAAIALGFWLIAARRDETLRRRASVAAVGGVLSLSLAYVLFPAFFGGPWVEVDPDLMRLWLSKVAELQPLWPSAAWEVGRLIWYVGSAVAAVPYVIWLIARERREPSWAGWLFVGICLAMFLVTALFRVRFSAFAELLAAVLAVDLIHRACHALRRVEPPALRGLARSAVAAAVLTGPLLLGGAIWARNRPEAAAQATGQALCSLQDLSRFLASEPAFADSTLTIAAHVDFGPELLYRTRHRVLATPYHRNRDGVLDTHRLLASADADAGRDIVRARGVHLVLLCPTRDRGFFLEDSEAGSLYQRLVDRQPPAWLAEVALPPGLSDGFLLYEVSD